MDILVLGGSVFAGRAVVAEAVELGHRVTVFNRGKSGSTPIGATQLTGDRTNAADLAQLAGQEFDIVVDTSGYEPAHVGAAARLLAPTCGFYAFVSTINVFPGWPKDADYRAGGVHQGQLDATESDAPDQGAAYGWLKAGCELAVVDAFGTERSSLLRAGCLAGPGDSEVARLPWWIERVARGGEVLVPGPSSAPVALIDARDLARFALLAAAGTYEVAGTAVSRAELMAACQQATGSDTEFTYVDEEWLAAQEVAPWREVPLWAPHSAAPSIFDHDPGPAIAAGLNIRPILDTVTDTWSWQRAIPGGWAPSASTPGLAPAKEKDLLAQWHLRRDVPRDADVSG